MMRHDYAVAKSSLTVAMSVFLVVNTAAIAARVYVRLFLIRGFGWDDATLCLAYLAFVISCAMGFTSMHFGYAYGGAPEDWPHWDAVRAANFYYGNQVSLYLTAAIVKLAVALVLYRLAVNTQFKAILGASIAIVAIWSILTTVFSAGLCATHGTTNYISNSTCTAVGFFRTISNIFIDYFYALFPILMLRNAKMSFRMKLSVCTLLGLGLFASAATIAKLVIIVQLNNVKDQLGKDMLHFQLLLWADVEAGLSIFCASAAALRPLLRRFLKFWGATVTGSSQMTYGRSAEATTSCNPLSGADPELSHTVSATAGPAGIQEYELSKMDSDKSLEQQDGCLSGKTHSLPV